MRASTPGQGVNEFCASSLECFFQSIFATHGMQSSEYILYFYGYQHKEPVNGIDAAWIVTEYHELGSLEYYLQVRDYGILKDLQF